VDESKGDIKLMDCINLAQLFQKNSNINLPKYLPLRKVELT